MFVVVGHKCQVTMKLINCTWEVANIGKKTLEIECTPNDVFDKTAINQVLDDYEYVVVKVPTGNIGFMLGLPDIGFKFIETQIKLSKSVQSFNYEDKLVRFFGKRTTIQEISDEESLQRVLSSMTPGMFTTDRIHLDPKLGPTVGLRRYRNWVNTEWHRGTHLIEIVFNGIPIGFSLLRMEEKSIHGLLGGIYEPYQGMGVGLLTVMNAFIYRKQEKLTYTDFKTSISSNNLPVLELYNYLNFKIDGLHYVYIKHL